MSPGDRCPQCPVGSWKGSCNVFHHSDLVAETGGHNNVCKKNVDIVKTQDFFKVMLQSRTEGHDILQNIVLWYWTGNYMHYTLNICGPSVTDIVMQMWILSINLTKNKNQNFWGVIKGFCVSVTMDLMFLLHLPLLSSEIIVFLHMCLPLLVRRAGGVKSRPHHWEWEVEVL